MKRIFYTEFYAFIQERDLRIISQKADNDIDNIIDGDDVDTDGYCEYHRNVSNVVMTTTEPSGVWSA